MNEQFLKTYESNVGQVTFIETVRKQRPPGLRKPYDYILWRNAAEIGYANLRTFIKSIEQLFQCAYCAKKGLSRGMRLNIFMLGYRPGLTGDSTGATKEQWDVVTSDVQRLLIEMLGPDAQMYIEPFTTERKFQARFETYIAYTEML